MRKKLGVSMLALIITMTVIIILATTISIQTTKTTRRERLSVFSNNISIIEEYIKSCEILKEELPFNGEISREEVLSLVYPEDLNAFEKELNSTADYSTTTFKKIDMTKVGVKKQFYGYGKEGPNDIFIYSETTGKVYYLMGVSYDNKTYFSINKDIINFVN